MTASLTHLIPLQELSPGAVGAIRNQVINEVVALASSELRMPPEALVVRDVNPVRDLQMYSTITTAATVEDWIYTASQAAGYVTVATANMGDQRYCALYGVRDLRKGLGPHMTATVARTSPLHLPSYVSLVRINVGGADKVIWDVDNLEAYTQQEVGFSSTAVIIPQNTVFTISYYKRTGAPGGSSQIMRLQLIGIVVEPRGKVISP